jgi:hypothetical protein
MTFSRAMPRGRLGLAARMEDDPMPIDEKFQRVARLAFNPYVRSSGTEHVALLLYSLVRMARPRTVVEYGSGYTTLFLLAALADNARDIEDERAALHAKTLAAGEIVELDLPWKDPRVGEWFGSGDKACGVDPAYYLDAYVPQLFSVEGSDESHEYVRRMREAVAELRLAPLLTHLTGAAPSVDILPERAFPIDLAWNDDKAFRTFFETYWPHLNPRGGLMVFHNTTAVKCFWDEIVWMKEARAAAGDLELLTMQEPHKLAQNSCTILRRTSGFQPRFLANVSAPEVFEALRRFRKTDLTPR